MAVISLSDYCSTLEGDESYSCWRAYFELKDLQVSSIYLSDFYKKKVLYIYLLFLIILN